MFPLCKIFQIYYFKIILVLNASQNFYNGSTTVPVDKKDPTGRKRETPLLCMTSDPEEKRKIIGDTFMRVLNLFHKVHPPPLCRIDFFNESQLLFQ